MQERGRACRMMQLSDAAAITLRIAPNHAILTMGETGNARGVGTDRPAAGARTLPAEEGMGMGGAARMRPDDQGYDRQQSSCAGMGETALVTGGTDVQFASIFVPSGQPERARIKDTGVEVFDVYLKWVGTNHNIERVSGFYKQLKPEQVTAAVEWVGGHKDVMEKRLEQYREAVAALRSGRVSGHSPDQGGRTLGR